MCSAASRTATASRRLDQPRRSTLRVARGAKQAAFELMEGLGSCEKTVTTRIAHDDTRLLRSDLDNVAVGHYTRSLFPVRSITDSKRLRSPYNDGRVRHFEVLTSSKESPRRHHDDI